MSSKKVLKLDFEGAYDFLLLGLISGFRDYKLCFELNDLLKLNFQRRDDVILAAGRPGSTTRHSYFDCQGGDFETYHILSNRDKAGTGFFIQEKKNVDFFLIINGTSSGFNVKNLISEIRTIDIISGVYKLDPYDIKSAESFLIFLES